LDTLDGFVPVLDEKELKEGEMKLISIEVYRFYSLSNLAKFSLSITVVPTWVAVSQVEPSMV